MRRCLAAMALLTITASSLHAAEPNGCDGFKWPIAGDRQALAASDIPQLDLGATIVGDRAARLRLAPIQDAKLPQSPERKPKDDAYAGAVMVDVRTAGVFIISMTEAAWVDVIQSDAFVKPAGFSGSIGCDGIRKTMRFELKAGRAIVQFSNVQTPDIRLRIRSE